MNAVRNVYTNFGQSSGDQHPPPTGCPSARLHDDLHVAAEEHEEPHEPVEREPGEPASDQGRDLRLIDFQHFSGSGLRQSALLDQRRDLRTRCRSRRGSPSAPWVYSFFLLISVACFRRCLIRSMSAFGVVTPLFDFF